MRPGSITKTCRRVAAVVDGGEHAEVELERFASFDDDGLTVEAPTVQVIAQERISLGFAAYLAETVARMVEIAQETAAAA